MNTQYKSIIEYYNKGYTQPETAKKFNLSQSGIRLILIRYNIPIRKFDKSGKNNPKWKGGVMNDRERKLIYSPNHPKPNFLGKYCYEYILKMEKKIGRYLKSNEVIHHKNGDVTDNRISNLQLMTQSEHAKLHSKEYAFKKSHDNFYNVYKNIKRDKKGRWKKYD